MLYWFSYLLFVLCYAVVLRGCDCLCVIVFDSASFPLIFGCLIMVLLTVAVLLA